MNKMVKGSVAGATGIVLLMGGYGSYALWTDSASVDSASVTSGELDVAAGTAVWDDASTSAAHDWSASDLLVPGDVVKRTQTFTLTGTGKNLTGKLVFDGGSVSKGTFGSDLDVDVDVTGDGPFTSVDSTDGGEYAFSSPFDTATVTTVVTFTFNGTSATAQDAQDATAALSGASFTLQQN